MQDTNPSPSKAGSDSTEWQLWSGQSERPATHLAIFQRDHKTMFKVYYVGRPPISELSAIMHTQKPALTTVELCEWQQAGWATVYYGDEEPRP